MALSQEQGEAEDNQEAIRPTGKTPMEDRSVGRTRNVSYGTEEASRYFTPAARKTNGSPTVLREQSNNISRLQRMMERRSSENQFNLTYTSMGDWVEISAPILGEHLVFLVKE